MRVPADLLYVVLVVAGVIGYRRRGERAMIFLGVVGATALALDVSKLPTIGLQFGLLDAALVVLAAVAVLDIQGLPPRIARYVPIGRRSREWEFDRRLHAYREKLDRSLGSHPPTGDWSDYRRWQANVVRDGRALLAKMKRLAAPDDAWAGVRDDYIDLYSGILTLIAHDDPPDSDYTSERGLELKQRADILRLKYRASADALLGRR
jgi:uncharacterized membrane protein (UPF0136 family)